MSPQVEFGYNEQIAPPAPFVSIELRSPASPANSKPDQMTALIDTGAYGSVIPNSLVEKLNLCMVSEVEVGDYEASKEEDFKTKSVYSVHLNIPNLPFIIVEVTSFETEDYAIIGRNVINEWLLTLDGPKLKGLINI